MSPVCASGGGVRMNSDPDRDCGQATIGERKTEGMKLEGRARWRVALGGQALRRLASAGDVAPAVLRA